MIKGVIICEIKGMEADPSKWERTLSNLEARVRMPTILVPRTTSASTTHGAKSASPRLGNLFHYLGTLWHYLEHHATVVGTPNGSGAV
jgi:hypothetical protein